MNLLESLEEAYKDISIGYLKNTANKQTKEDYLNHINETEKYFKDNHVVDKPSDELKDYTSRGGSGLNSALWQLKLNNYKLHTTQPNSLKKINEIFDKENGGNSEHSLYAGMRPAKFKPSDIIHIPSFISTSIDPKIAVLFAHNDMPNTPAHILHIKTRKGQKMIYTEPFSIHKREKEVLLPNNSVIKILKTKKVTYRDQPLYIHDAHIMNDDEIQANKDHPEVESYLRMKDELNKN